MNSENLQDLGGGKKSRYDFRVHAMLLMTSGHSTERIGSFFGVDPSVVLEWVRRLQAGGTDALHSDESAGPVAPEVA